MKARMEYPNDTKKLFKDCGTCSRTFAHLLNREFGHPDQPAERAINLMAGGIMNQGFQCGMLWGAALAVGGEAHRRQEDLDRAIAAAVNATQGLIASFEEQIGHVNCREIIGIDLTTEAGMAEFMQRVASEGMENSHCFNLAEQWAPKAKQAADNGMDSGPEPVRNPRSCASEVVRKMGGSEEEMAMVAGFAGGLGLYGGGCGALSAAIWKTMLTWCREHPDQEPPYFNNETARKILEAFKAETNGKMLCSEICGHRFADLFEHTDYLNEGGCSRIMGVLAKAADA